MRSKFMSRYLGVSILGLCLLLGSIDSRTQDAGIPDFGEGNAVSLSQEYVMGRAWLMPVSYTHLTLPTKIV